MWTLSVFVFRAVVAVFRLEHAKTSAYLIDFSEQAFDLQYLT